MTDRDIAVHTAVSVLLWPVGIALVLTGLATKWELGQLGIVLCMIAATLTVRGYMCSLEHRTRDAFEFGQEIGMESVERRRPHSLN